MDTLTFDLLARFARGKKLRRAHLDHSTTSDVHITTKSGEQHRVIGFNRLEVIVHGDRDGHIEKISFDDIKHANAYEVEA